MKKEYSNNDITVVWKPEMCQHSGKCFGSLPAVFDPRRSPWIVMSNGTTEEIIKTVNNCPSKALSFYNKKSEEKKNE
jgi:uncharacterized Fe-S cluster protein YjdI